MKPIGKFNSTYFSLSSSINYLLPMHYLYEKTLKHKADFRVKYRFISHQNGGREHSPFQGIRFDFSYDDDINDKVYIILPELRTKREHYFGKQ